MLQEMLDILNKNAGALNVVFGFLVATATAIYAVLTWGLVRETRRMREAQTNPEISVHVQPSETWINFIEMVIENNGMGVALDIHLKAEPDIEYDKGKYISELGMFKYGIRILPPRQSIKTFLLSVPDRGEEILKPDGPFQFTVDMDYRNATGSTFHRQIEVNLLHLVGLTQIGTPPLRAIAKNLESIKNDISAVSSMRRLQVITYNQEDMQREYEERSGRRKDQNQPRNKPEDRSS